MTPYEKAKKHESEPKPCCECEKSERVGNALYCTVNGKMILPRFEDLCICRGKLKGADNDQRDKDHR